MGTGLVVLGGYAVIHGFPQLGYFVGVIGVGFVVHGFGRVAGNYNESIKNDISTSAIPVPVSVGIQAIKQKQRK